MTLAEAREKRRKVDLGMIISVIYCIVTQNNNNNYLLSFMVIVDLAPHPNSWTELTTPRY